MKTIINRTNITSHLVEYQLNLIGKTTVETLDEEMWWDVWTITEKQEQTFKEYAIPLLKKIFKFNKSKAESTFGWFILQYGLRTKN